MALCDPDPSPLRGWFVTRNTVRGEGRGVDGLPLIDFFLDSWASLHFGSLVYAHVHVRSLTHKRNRVIIAVLTMRKYSSYRAYFAFLASDTILKSEYADCFGASSCPCSR